MTFLGCPYIAQIFFRDDLK